MCIGEMLEELRGFTEMTPGASMFGESSELSTAANRVWRCKRKLRAQICQVWKSDARYNANTQTSYSPDGGWGKSRMSGGGDR